MSPYLFKYIFLFSFLFPFPSRTLVTYVLENSLLFLRSFFYIYFFSLCFILHGIYCFILLLSWSFILQHLIYQSTSLDTYFGFWYFLDFLFIYLIFHLCPGVQRLQGSTTYRHFSFCSSFLLVVFSLSSYYLNKYLCFIFWETTSFCLYSNPWAMV